MDQGTPHRICTVNCFTADDDEDGSQFFSIVSYFQSLEVRGNDWSSC